MRLEDIAARLGDQIDAIRSSLDGQEDVAVVDARDTHGGTDALLVATRQGHPRHVPLVGCTRDRADAAGLGRLGDVRASTVQTMVVGVRARLDAHLPGPQAHATPAPSGCGAST